jgi:hypothetical protein
MDVQFLESLRQQIYVAGVNAVIPWATLQTADWYGGDPNPGTAFRVDGKGGYSIEPGYWYFKHVCRTGQPGMAVATVSGADPEVQAIAFSSNNTKHPDAVTLFHLGSARKDMRIFPTGAKAQRYDVFVTDRRLKHQAEGTLNVRQGAIELTIYPDQAVTLVAKS